MGFRDEFLLTQKTYAEWSLEKTVQSGLKGSQQEVHALKKAVAAKFDEGIDRLAKTQMATSAALQGELAYQSDRLREELAYQTRLSK